jgi:hypothetical protein
MVRAHRLDFYSFQVRSLLDQVTGRIDPSAGDEGSVDATAAWAAELAVSLRAIGLDAGMFDALQWLFAAASDAGHGGADWSSIAEVRRPDPTTPSRGRPSEPAWLRLAGVQPACDRQARRWSSQRHGSSGTVWQRTSRAHPRPSLSRDERTGMEHHGSTTQRRRLDPEAVRLRPGSASAAHATVRSAAPEEHAMTPSTAKQFQDAEGTEDWRVLAQRASAWFRASSHVAGAGLTEADVDVARWCRRPHASSV